MTEQYAIECRQITKVFGSVVANDKIDLTVRYGEIMALLGENGSGKTTLMNMLSGIYHPDAGSILVGGKEVSINSPVDSRNLGISQGCIAVGNRYGASAFQTGGSVQCDGKYHAGNQGKTAGKKGVAGKN